MSHMSLYQLAILASIRASKDGLPFSGADKLAVHALDLRGKVICAAGPTPGVIIARPRPNDALLPIYA